MEGVDLFQSGFGGRGPTGPNGPTGPAGPVGPRGIFGGNGFSFTFSTDTADSDPGDGNIKFNNATYGDVSEIYVDLEEFEGTDITAWLNSLADANNNPAAVLKIFSQVEPTRWATFTLTSVTSAVGYRKLTVVPVASSLSFTTDPGDTNLVFAPAGNAGAVGGPAGDTGDIPFLESSTVMTIDAGVFRYDDATNTLYVPKVAIRDTSAAFDVTLAATSSSALSAGRTLTFDVVNAARTIKLTGNPTLADWFDQSVKSGASPTFGTVTAALAGNALTAAALQTARSIGGVPFNGTADTTVATATGGFTVSGGALALGANNLTMTGIIGATGSRVTKLWVDDITCTNPVSGSIIGNAATATALATGRTINSVNFDGTTNITVTAAAGTLTGTTLNPTVTGSSLTSLGVQAVALDMGSRRINNVTDPESAQDVATKAYVDAVAVGLDTKPSCRAATTVVGGNITLSGAQTIDGVSVIAGDRVLVKNQSIAADNGIYVVAAGSWARSTDADTSAEVTSGMFVFITEGATNLSTGWTLITADTITLGATSLTFAQFSGAGTYTATGGVTLTGNQFLITALGITNGMLAGSIAAAKLVGTDIATVGTLTQGATGAGFTIAIGTSTVTGVLSPANGGTGVANNAASTITVSGNFATTITVTGVTGVTLPTSGTLATLAGAESLLNKKLGSLTSNGLVTTSAGDGTLSVTVPGTGVLTALTVNVGSAGAFVVNGGALGTPSGGVVTNLTGTASININGTVGATTPAAGTFTALRATGNLIVDGDVTVSGNVFDVDVTTINVEDPLIKLAKSNAADAVDIGFYGLYTSGGAKYYGIFRDATDGKIRVFTALEVEPTTTVNIGGTGYTVATLVANLEGNASTASAVAVGGITGLGTGVATALAINVGSAGAFVTLNGAGGTPSAITLTNGTGLPVSGIAASTTLAIGVGSVELGHATDSTLARSGPGKMSLEGKAVPLMTGAIDVVFAGPTAPRTYTFADASVTIADLTSTQTMSGKTLTSPVVAILKPVSDSMTAVQITQANGATAIVTVDTINGRLGVGTTPATTLDLVCTASGSGMITARNLDAAGFETFDFINSGGTLTTTIGHSNTSASILPNSTWIATRNAESLHLCTNGPTPRVTISAAGDTTINSIVGSTMLAPSNVIEEITTIASDPAPTPTGGSLRNFFSVTALATDPTFAAPSGTPFNNNYLTIRVKPTADRTAAWNGIYRGTLLPASFANGKTSYTGFRYNGADSKWDCVAHLQVD